MRNPEQVVIAQTEFVGKPRNRHYRIQKGDDQSDFSFPRTSRVVGIWNETTGETGFLPASNLPNVPPSDLPHFPRSKAARINLATQKPTLSTALKKRTTTAGVNMDEIYRQRGGDPDYRPPKTGGFFFRSTPAEIAAERRRKLALARKGL